MTRRRPTTRSTPQPEQPAASRRAWLLALLAVVALAGAVRLVRLGTPNELVPLDERIYVSEAIGLTRNGVEGRFPRGDTPFEGCDTAELTSWYVVHPPVGKWLIAAGIETLGCGPIGWRLPSALAGIGGVGLTIAIARRLRIPLVGAIAAATLVAVDGLHVVMSRLAMLDIFASTFLLLTVWLALRAREATGRGRTWMLAATGVSTGLAIGSKWAIALVVPVAWWLALRRTGDAATGSDPVARPARWALLAVPALLVYVVAYLPWFFASSEHRPRQCDGRGGIGGWVCYQATSARSIAGFATSRESIPVARHPSLTRGYSLLWEGRPTTHLAERTAPGSSLGTTRILGLPNPALWFPGLFVGLPIAAVVAARRRDPRFVAVALAAGLLVVPWLLVPFGIFTYYMTPAIPFLALALALAAERATKWPASKVALAAAAVAGLPIAFGVGAALSRTGMSRGLAALLSLAITGAMIAGGARLLRGRREMLLRRRAIVVAPAILAVALFAYFYPVLTDMAGKQPSSPYEDRLWLQADCDVPRLKVACWQGEANIGGPRD